MRYPLLMTCLVALLCVSCSRGKPTIVGKWQTHGGGMLDFHEDGTVVIQNEGRPRKECRYRMPDEKHVEFLLPKRDEVFLRWEVLSLDKTSLSIKRPGADQETLTRMK